MKHLLLLATTFVLLVSTAFAQSGRPLYTITVTRGGNPLGEIKLALYPDIAPKHVANFDSLVSIGFFDGTAFHRVVPGFVIQGGDPNSRDGDTSTWGYGDPSQTKVPAEFSRISHQRGILSAARTPDPNSATSQFFICVAAATNLDGKYSVHGVVVEGMDVVDAIVASPTVSGTQRPVEKIVISVVRTGTDTATPGSPNLTFPANDTTGIAATQTVRWSSVSGSILYQVQRSTTPDFSTIDFKDSVTGTSTSLKNLPQGGVKNYWRVRASNGGNRGAWSEVWSFTTAGASSVEEPRNSATPRQMDLSRIDVKTHAGDEVSR